MIQDKELRGFDQRSNQPSPSFAWVKSFVLQTEKLRPGRRGVWFRVTGEFREMAGGWESREGERKTNRRRKGRRTWERSHLVKLRGPCIFCWRAAQKKKKFSGYRSLLQCSQAHAPLLHLCYKQNRLGSRKHTDPIPRDSDEIGVGWGPGIRIFISSSGDPNLKPRLKITDIKDLLFRPWGWGWWCVILI